MLVRERQKAIINYLAKTGFVSVADLCHVFGVSEMTVRRDMIELEKQGLLQRTYGGAIASEPAFFEISSRAKSFQFVEEKERIGKVAAEMVMNSQVVFLDSGTTTLNVARHLKCKTITVVTNDLNIAFELIECRDIEIYVVGGNLRRGTNNLLGPKSVKFFDDIRGDIFFLAVEGVDEKTGFTVPDLNEVQLKQKMVASSVQTIVVADHSKFGRNTMGFIAPISAASHLITDRDTPKPIADAIGKYTHVILA
jgi:DeoR family fructose operon transcriptional repressor